MEIVIFVDSLTQLFVLAPLTEENLEKASVIVSTAIDGLRAEVFRDIKGKFGNNVSKWNADAEKIAKDVRNQSKQIEENTDRVKKLVSLFFLKFTS